jgi:hypothetical protein
MKVIKMPTNHNNNKNNSPSISQEDYDRLLEIQEEMLSLLQEAQSIVRNTGHKHTTEVMRAYWYPSIKTGLTNEHEFLSNNPSMQDAINTLEVYLPDEDNDGSSEEDEQEE